MIVSRWLDKWLLHHFAMDTAVFCQEMKNKPLAPADLVVTNFAECILQCKHCFMVEPDDWYHPLLDSDLHEILADHQQPGIQRTSLYPHEPLLITDTFLSILEQYPQTVIDANPALLAAHPHVARRLLELGVTKIYYSLHGTSPGHTTLTGQNEKDWHKLVEGFHFLADMGFQLGINSCACRPTIDYIEEMGTVINDIPNVIAWSILRVIPMGRAQQLPDDWLYLGEACGPVVRRIAKLFSVIKPSVRCDLETPWGPNYFGDLSLQLIGRGGGELLRGIWNCHIPSDIILDRKCIHLSKFSSQCYPCIFGIGIPELSLGRYENGSFHFNEELIAKLHPENRIGKLEGRCGPERCPFAPLCAGCPFLGAIFAKKSHPSSDINLHHELDFCISRYIYENRHDTELMLDLSSLIQFKPI